MSWLSVCGMIKGGPSFLVESAYMDCTAVVTCEQAVFTGVCHCSAIMPQQFPACSPNKTHLIYLLTEIICAAKISYRREMSAVNGVHLLRSIGM